MRGPMLPQAFPLGGGAPHWPVGGAAATGAASSGMHTGAGDSLAASAAAGAPNLVGAQPMADLPPRGGVRQGTPLDMQDRMDHQNQQLQKNMPAYLPQHQHPQQQHHQHPQQPQQLQQHPQQSQQLQQHRSAAAAQAMHEHTYGHMNGKDRQRHEEMQEVDGRQQAQQHADAPQHGRHQEQLQQGRPQQMQPWPFSHPPGQFEHTPSPFGRGRCDLAGSASHAAEAQGQRLAEDAARSPGPRPHRNFGGQEEGGWPQARDHKESLSATSRQIPAATRGRSPVAGSSKSHAVGPWSRQSTEGNVFTTTVDVPEGPKDDSDADLDDEEDLELSSNHQGGWSRQTTLETTFSTDSYKTTPAGHLYHEVSGLTLSVKNSFLDVHDDDVDCILLGRRASSAQARFIDAEQALSQKKRADGSGARLGSSCAEAARPTEPQEQRSEES